MRRFHVASELLALEHFELPADLARHLKVLRIAAGDRIELFDGAGRLAEALVTEARKDGYRVSIQLRSDAQPDPFSLRLIQGIPKGAKMDLVLQKGTELGISRFSPVYCRNGDVKPGTNQLSGRSARWLKIVQEAARQSRRPFVPQLDQAVELAELLPTVTDELLLVPWEQGSVPLQQHLQQQRFNSVSVLIGPEGGFTSEEIGLAEKAGFKPVTLGPRILRSETAGIAVASVLQYLFGNFGSCP